VAHRILSISVALGQQESKNNVLLTVVGTFDLVVATKSTESGVRLRVRWAQHEKKV
jgi:hypothetical protein